MDSPRSRTALALAAHFVLATLFASAATVAAPVTIKGATFDAPPSCQPADGALVCRVDGVQMELWVTRKPLAPFVAPTDTFARKMVYFNDVHDTAVGNILRSTNNEKATPFSSYGAYSALGTAMPGKGVPTSPAVRFASVLHDEEIWEFLEVAATRSPGLDSLSEALQRSLVLPSAAAAGTAAPRLTLAAPATVAAAVPSNKPAPIAPPKSAAAPPSASLAPSAPAKSVAALSAGPTPPKVEAAPLPAPASALFSGPLLSMQYPDFLQVIVIENSISRVAVNFKDKARSTGPELSVILVAPQDKQITAASVVKARKDAQTAMMAGPSGSVDVSTLGAIKGVGFALIGVPDAKKGLSGVESIETTFAADVPRGILEVRLTAESKFSADAEAVWALLAKSLQLAK